MHYKILFLLSFLFVISSESNCQEITIKGQVYHAEDPAFNLLIVNKSTARGTFGERDGSFTLKAQKTDTILVGALGFETVKICMADSLFKDMYSVKLYLTRKHVKLEAVSIFPERDLEKIQKDIRALGYNEHDYMLSGIDAFQSPITFLYQQFSRAERQKRRAYEIINEDRKRDLLKELFSKYVDFEIINLQKDQFDDFIDFMNVSDALLMNMSQYDFIMYTKKRYLQFKQLPPRLRQDIDTHD